MRWLHTLANQVGLVGTVHRLLASSSDPVWVEPSPALASTLPEFGWTVVRNVVSMRATRWPELDPEPAYSGKVIRVPRDGQSSSDAVWTDGSIKMKGGAAALQRGSERHFAHAAQRGSESVSRFVAAFSFSTHAGKGESSR